MSGEEQKRVVTQAEIFAQLMNDGENKKCAECGAPRPTWASVNLGIFLCIKCASNHRSYGVQASFVRSLTLDNWAIPQQTEYLRQGGNKRFRDFFAAEEHSIPDEHKFLCPTADKYRRLLAADVREALIAQGIDPDAPANPAAKEEAEDETVVMARPAQPADRRSSGVSHRSKKAVGLGSADFDEEEEQKLFGKAVNDPSDSSDPSDFSGCCSWCACRIL